MRNKIIAKRYGEAYVAFAAPKIGMEHCVEEMKGLKWLLKSNPELGRLLKTPEIPFSEKFSLIDRVFSGSYSDQLRDFLKHLITKGRMDCLSDVADHIRMKYTHTDTAEALLRTTFPLELDLIERIKASLQKRLGKNVNLHLELDPDLLGGVQIVIGNTIIDGSVRHKLQGLRKQLLKTA